MLLLEACVQMLITQVTRSFHRTHFEQVPIFELKKLSSRSKTKKKLQFSNSKSFLSIFELILPLLKFSDNNWDRAPSVSEIEQQSRPRDRDRSGDPGVRLRDELRLVMGASGLVDSQRDVSSGDEDGGVLLRGELQHALHLPHRAGLPVDAVPHEGGNLLLFRGVDRGHGAVRRVPAAGNQGRADRRDGGERVEEALVLEEIHGPKRRPGTTRFFLNQSFPFIYFAICLIYDT